MSDYVDRMMRRSAIEHQEEWGKWGKEAPWLQFPPELEVKIMPPFGGAMARFMARFANSTDADRHVSVYWDCLDTLSIMGEPYWEIYPVKIKDLEGEYKEDTARFLVGEEPQMMVAIIKSLMGEYE